ncbi:MAG: DUF3147 family protein [Desulfobacterota bacterium]|jgi:uncharacterized membrane protein (GlpM family)|nr:DUF3147 family protein [Thermodesulfobacteriota bacterium]
MQLAIKIAVSLAVILLATHGARRFPSAAGLLGVMPLTGALVLVWVYLENQGDPGIMTGFAKGALWGMVPSILFFLAAFLCLKKGLPLAVVLLAGFAAWLLGAVVHQWWLK